MTRFISIIILFSALFTLASCTASDSAQLYYEYDMNDYIAVDDYSKSVDRNSDNYKKMYREYYKDAFGDKLAYKVKEGSVLEGDKVNINYIGMYNGEEFDGGTEYGYALTVGDGLFIVEGFEKKLIGTPLGGEVVFNAILPDSYHNKELAGKEVTYTVQINSITRYPMPDDEEAKKYGFESYEDFNDRADSFAIGVCVFNNAYDSAEIKSFPKEETELLMSVLYDDYVESCAEKGVSVEDYVASVGWTMDRFNSHLKDSIQKDFRKMPRDLLSYYILQTEDQKLTQKEILEFTDNLPKKYGIKAKDISDIELERMAVYEKALDVCFQMAEVK